ncbi:lipid-A-disaccharide synthase [Desulfoplanes sp.]
MRKQRCNAASSNKVWICVGEASGDVYGAMLVDALKKIDPALTCAGMGGAAMRRAGFEARIHSETLSVMGLTEVIGHLPRIIGLLASMRRMLEKERPAVVVLIDSPDFNFRVAKMAKKLSIPVVYYITPQVWAWRRGRVGFLEQYVDRLLCIFPFEEPFFRNHGIDVDFVGHPLLEIMDLAARSRARPGEKRIGILPGSRQREVVSLLPVFAKTASYLFARDGGLRFTLVRAPHVDPGMIQEFWPDGVPVEIVPSTERYDALQRCSFVMAASGTATFECALLGVPTMLAYKVAFLSYHVGRKLIRVPFIGMANLILGTEIFPEFIQDRATPEALAALAQSWIEHPERLEAIRKELKALPKMMGTGTATERAAGIIAEYLSPTD